MNNLSSGSLSLPMHYFQKQLDALKTEREEDRKLYLQQTEHTSVSERRTNGLTWYPVAIRGSETGLGDYITLEIERTTHHHLAHQLRSGMPAALFSNHDPANDRLSGVISFLSGNRLKIKFQKDELPEWTHQGKLGVDLLFDENSYEEMIYALKTAESLVNNVQEGRLVRVITGETSPAFTEKTAFPQISELNTSQMRALNQVIASQDLAIIHGPPGTGKTTALVRTIKTILTTEQDKILVVAPSNTAVDLLTERLFAEGISVLRIGNPARVSEQLLQHTLEYKTDLHSGARQIKSLRKRAAEFKNMAHRYKRNFGKAERDQRRALFNEANKIMREVDMLEAYIVEDIIGNTQVITATLVGANHYTVKHLRYGTAVIDEAGQSLEPACWIPILKAQRLVLAGDHLQLPPTIKSTSGLVKEELGITLLEKCVQRHPSSVTLLEEQYRMNEAIMNFSSTTFYQGRLKAHESVAAHVVFEGDQPLEYIDTAGCGFDEKSEGTSTANPDEAALLISHLTQLISTLEDNGLPPEHFPSVAIISPYKQQVTGIRELLASHEVMAKYGNNISVNTVDSFQGQERDIVYISMTRSNSHGEIGFLADIRRMNVAMTRARKKLVVVGDSATLSNHPFYMKFITYAESVGSHKSAWEFLPL